MDSYTTKYGILQNVGEHELYPDGTIKDCMFTDKEELHTEYGVLIPQYEFEEHRRKYINSISFYENGALRRIALNDITDVITPIGMKSAELLAFYQSGRIKRLFPLNGRISAYWDENEEYKLASEDTLELPCGTIRMKIIAYSFYEDGAIKNLTFWPKEMLKLRTPIGEVKIRIGVSFYPKGEIKTIEPAYPVAVQTPIGMIKAYDATANGITGGSNSLMFSEEGKVLSLVTSGMKVMIEDKDGRTFAQYSPLQDMDEDEIEISFKALKLDFNGNSVRFNDGETYDLSDNHFVLEAYFKTAPSECANCASCGQCLP